MRKSLEPGRIWLISENNFVRISCTTSRTTDAFNIYDVLCVMKSKYPPNLMVCRGRATSHLRIMCHAQFRRLRGVAEHSVQTLFREDGALTLYVWQRDSPPWNISRKREKILSDNFLRFHRSESLVT